MDNDRLEHDEQFRQEKQVERPITIGEKGQRQWLYPVRLPGHRAQRRKIAAISLIVFYFLTPWLEFSGRPLLRVDVLQGTAYFFGLVLRMQEYNFAFFLFIILALLLFLFTTLFGRIWCGYACPQTVFVDWIIRPIEELLEGKAARRRVFDKQKWTKKKIAIKTLKHGVFIFIALLVANAFLGFFIDPRVILSWIFSPPSRHPIAFGFVMFIAALMYFDLAWFREQFCSFVCPYARFQSALLDAGSPSVVYDKSRGEPRGTKEGSGDCINCSLCVRVCPTGIDIRDGLQLECIQCERCVDACDSVMTNLKRRTGLIKISAPNDFQGKSVAWYLRPRVILYSTLIVLALVFAAFKIGSRDDLALTILRVPSSTYSTLGDGRISNLFNVRGYNSTAEKMMMELEIIQPQNGVEIICPGCQSLIESRREQLSPLIVIFTPHTGISEVKIKAKNGREIFTLPLIQPQ